MSIKAIETTYKGYRFRSRLEARWAVFFDHLGLRWEYEPEGFELKAGRYLPDFKVDTTATWVEIKAIAPTALEIEKMRELCGETEKYGIILYGQPGAHDFAWFHKGGVRDDETFEGRVNEVFETCWREFAHALTAARSARFEFGQSGARA